MEVELTKKQIEILKDLDKTNREIEESEVKAFYGDYKGLQKFGFIDYPWLDDKEPTRTKITKPLPSPIASFGMHVEQPTMIETISPPDNFIKYLSATRKITATGRAWLEAHKAKKVKWSIEFIIPTLISIGALVVSIIALVTK